MLKLKNQTKIHNKMEEIREEDRKYREIIEYGRDDDFQPIVGHTNYDFFTNYSEEELPKFAKLVFSEKILVMKKSLDLPN